MCTYIKPPYRIPRQLDHATRHGLVPNRSYYRVNWKKDILCINCGFGGHTSKNCNFPTTSFGIVSYKEHLGKMHYVMVQRKDTLCYTEFLRGKYDLGNLKYMSKLFSYMTEDEKRHLITHDFDALWKMLWINNNHVRKEYVGSKEKFCKLAKGYNLKTCNSELIFVDLKYLVETTPTLAEQEWEFPKGRRKINETDVMCALREFEEETSISRDFIQLTEGTKQYEEVFIGKNKVRYRNIFFLAKYSLDNLTDEFFDENNHAQINEIKDVRWMTYEEVCFKIRDKVEKLDLFRRIHSQLVKTKDTVPANFFLKY